MMDSAVFDNVPPVIERVTSGIAGLDRLLQGGFLKGGIYLIMGPPGAGKTVLGNQSCFHYVKQGGNAIYLTLLAETHARMLAHMRSFTFFAPEYISQSLSYISGYNALEQEGLEGLLRLIRQELRRHRAGFLVIDGAVTIGQTISEVREWKQFLHTLHGYTETMGCTILLLMQASQGPHDHPEHTMVDGLIELSMELVDVHTIREIQVHKFRGSDILMGKHRVEITKEGLVVYPRTESLILSSSAPLSQPSEKIELPERMATGIERLDEMLHGGIPANSTTLLLGAPGTGKTSLGLHFLYEGARQGQHCLYMGFYETPIQLMRRMHEFGMDIQEFMKAGVLELLWQPPGEDILDVLAQGLLDAVEQRHVQRLFIDGLGGFEQTIASAERLQRFFSVLLSALRARGVTTVCTVELPDLLSPTITAPRTMSGAATFAENIIFLRYVELHSQLYRLISIMKMRESGYDPAIREFRIGAHGIEVASTFASAEAILTGIARPSSVQQVIPPSQQELP